MPSAAKKLAIVHNDEPASAPDQESLHEATQETSEESSHETSQETVEVTVEEIVAVTSQADGQEPEQRPEALRLLEAMLFAAADPLDEATLKRALPDGVDIKFSLVQLQQEYATRGVNLVRVGKKWTFRTANDLSWLLTKQTIETRKLSRAAIETLAIVAYHQPVTRAEIEEIRGVQTATGTLDVLLKTGWIRPRGRRKAPGRPITYGTSEEFLSHFGLEEVADLPGLDELKGAGLLEGTMPDGFGVPMPSDDSTLRDDEDPLEPGDLELDLGLAPPEAQVEGADKAEAAAEPEQGEGEK
ncbi:MAG TPA: SMC-Scp complex subunit ScpB [Pseudolabrys sp.]